MEIFDEGRAAVSTHRQEILAERDIIRQLQEHLAETQAQVDDWNFWYDQEYVSEHDMVQEDQDEDEAAEANQVQPIIAAPQQPQSTPITPPVVQGHVPAELLPPALIPSFVMTPLPQIQPSTAVAPPPPPPGPPPSEESPQQVSQPVIQQPSQPEPSVPSQQSLPSTHRCPEVREWSRTTATHDTSCMSAARHSKSTYCSCITSWISWRHATRKPTYGIASTTTTTCW